MKVLIEVLGSSLEKTLCSKEKCLIECKLFSKLLDNLKTLIKAFRLDLDLAYVFLIRLSDYMVASRIYSNEFDSMCMEALIDLRELFLEKGMNSVLS